MPLVFGAKLVLLSHRTADPDHPLIVKKAPVLVRALGLLRSNQTTYQGEIPAMQFRARETGASHHCRCMRFRRVPVAGRVHAPIFPVLLGKLLRDFASFYVCVPAYLALLFSPYPLGYFSRA